MKKYLLDSLKHTTGIHAILILIIGAIMFGLGYHARTNDIKMALGVNADKIIQNVLESK